MISLSYLFSCLFGKSRPKAVKFGSVQVDVLMFGLDLAKVPRASLGNKVLSGPGSIGNSDFFGIRIFQKIKPGRLLLTCCVQRVDQR